MFDLFLDYLSKIVDFGSVDLVGTFVKYFNALSSSPRHRRTESVMLQTYITGMITWVSNMLGLTSTGSKIIKDPPQKP
ncbi:hypothetical protein GCM10020255_060230 [Rhodococcus baikonurensis]